MEMFVCFFIAVMYILMFGCGDRFVHNLGEQTDGRIAPSPFTFFKMIIQFYFYHKGWKKYSR